MSQIFTNIHGHGPSTPLAPDTGPREPPRMLTFIDRRTGREKTVTVKRHQPIVERFGREAVDVKQCQAPSGRAGLTPVRVRCARPATCVAVENNPRHDGSIAAMALCDLCWKSVLASHGPDYAKVTPLTPDEAKK